MSNSKSEANEQQFSTKEVRIVPYDPQWKAEFEKIKAMIQSYIGEYVESIQHVGSTSVEGLEQNRLLMSMQCSKTKVICQK